MEQGINRLVFLYCPNSYKERESKANELVSVYMPGNFYLQFFLIVKETKTGIISETMEVVKCFLVAKWLPI